MVVFLAVKYTWERERVYETNRQTQTDKETTSGIRQTKRCGDIFGFFFLVFYLLLLSVVFF